MADRFLNQFLQTGPGVDLVVTTPAGDVLRLPLSLALAHATMASVDVLVPDAPAELLRWAWDDLPLCDDHDTEHDNCPTGPPVRRAARLIVEEIPLTVRVRRQLPDGSFGPVDVPVEEWAQNEGRITRG